ncbi:Amyloid-beta A4 precursor protein-binding A member 1 [Tyrophagus putrescentiae]|nr:Amyloid-beta A4 precursor protein-binding A member 1 [Tyrophagus putrescentiae]
MLNKADQGGQEGPPLPSQPPSQMPPSAAVRKGGAVRKSGFNACHPPTYHHNSNVPSRRLWNFMDISPSPSPPPLSPVEPVDCPGGAQRYEHHDQPLQCEAAQYTGTSQERPSPVGEQYQSATSTTSGYDGSSSSSNCRDHFKSTTKGGRFDINSLELNRVAPQEKNASTNAFKGDHRYYGDVPPMEKVPSARSASQSHSKHAAHFRLDSLLLSPDDPQPYKAPNSKSQQQQQLSNGIKKSNRFTLDVDDEDDVLFSRFHHHSSNGQPRPAASSTAAAIPASSKNFLKDSSNSYLIDSHRSSRERSAEATVMPTTVMSAGSRRETSVESMRSSRARALREELVDACARELVSKLPPQASSGPAATTMTAAVASSHCRMVKEDVGSISDNEDDDDDNGGFKAAGTTTNTATTATTTSNISTGARNRIELAGGRELFSSSRTMSAAQHCHRMPGEAAAVVSEEQLLETTTSAMTDPEDSRVVNAVPPVGLDEEEVVSSSNQEEEPVDVDSEDSNSSCGTSAKSFEGAASSPSHDERIARIIGSVPIAQYEGSPKRYGPKPGYPKRVLSTSSNNSCSNEYEPSILMMPNKKADTLLPADNDEEHRQHQRQLEEQDQLEQHKTKLVNLSLSENGSPHSSTHSSTSSATFSSTDIHSSSSFSCPSNAHHHHQHQHQHHPLPKLSSTSCGVAVAPSTRKVVAESNFPATEEIVKTILSLPSGQIDTEDDVDEDVTESSSDKATAGEEMLPPAIGAMIHSSSNSRTAAEPMYSSIASSGGYSAVDANKSSGYSSKRSLHSDDSESVTKSKTSISGSSGHGDRGSSLNRSSTSLKQQQSLSEANRSIGSQSTLDGSSVKQLNSAAQLASESASRNVPKSLRLEREGVVGSSSYHPHSQTRYQLEPSQSFESTDSSYRSSEQCPNSKDYYYGQSDDDLYLYGPGSKTSSGCYPGKAVAGGPTDRLTHSADRAIASGGSGNLNGGGSGFQEGTQSTKGTMMPPGGQRTSTQVPHLSYTALSPELSTSGLGGVGGDGGSKFYGVLDSTYESTGDYPSDNNTESYESETAGKSGCDGGGATGDGGRIKVMPILEDGLSSGMPSSDELEYDEDDEGEDEMVAHEHDLDEYVNEYHSNNSRSNQCEPTSMMQSQPPPSTTTSTTGSYGNATSSTLRLDQMVNGTASGGGSANYNYGHSYGKQVPPSGGDYARPHKSSDGQMYRCGKGSYGLEMAGEMVTKTKEASHDFYNGHHHHSNHHLHNHPVLGTDDDLAK